MAIKIGPLNLSIKSTIIVALLLALVCFLLIDHGGMKSNLNQTAKELKAEKVNSAAIQKKADEAIAGKEALKKEADKNLSSLAGSLTEKNGEIKKKDSRIAELEAALPGLKDKDEIISNQAQQISRWRGKCAFLENKIVDLGEPVEAGGVITYPPGSVTFELNQKYEVQLSITGDWITKYNAVRTERDKSEEAFKKSLKVLRWEKLKSKAKTGIVAAAAGGALYFTGSKPLAYVTWLAGFLNLIFGK
jgi:chromosome segregation ATPase